MRCKSIPVIVQMLVVGLIGDTVTAQQVFDATGESETGEQSTERLFNDGDLLFLHHMIMHHEQAVVMSLLVPTRSTRDEFVRFTGYVNRAQAAEIDLMQSLLDLAAKRGLELPEHRAHGDPPMAGMLSTTEMNALEAADNEEFERLWMEGMIYHHQGAIDMAHVQQRQQLENSRRPFALNVLVEDIVVEQRAEITKMHAWLNEWELTSTP